MDILNAIMHRRSVRRYTGERIPDSTVENILYAGLAAASSKSRRPCEFVVVREHSMLKKLAACRPNAGLLLESCDAAIVIAADSELSDVWVEDSASAMTQMHLAADALGVGSCWLQIRLRNSLDGEKAAQDVVRDLLGIPKRYQVMAILTLGLPAKHPGVRKVEDLPLGKIHRETF